MRGFVDLMQLSSEMLFAVGQDVFIIRILYVSVQHFTCLLENFRAMWLNEQFVCFLCVHGLPCVCLQDCVCVLVWLKRKQVHPTVERKSDHLHFSVPRAQQVSPSPEWESTFHAGRGWVGLRGGSGVEGRQWWRDDPNKKEHSGSPKCTLLELCDTWRSRPRDKTITANSWTHHSRTDHYCGFIHQHN